MVFPSNDPWLLVSTVERSEEQQTDFLFSREVTNHFTRVAYSQRVTVRPFCLFCSHPQTPGQQSYTYIYSTAVIRTGRLHDLLIGAPNLTGHVVSFLAPRRRWPLRPQFSNLNPHAHLRSPARTARTAAGQPLVVIHQERWSALPECECVAGNAAWCLASCEFRRRVLFAVVLPILARGGRRRCSAAARQWRRCQ